MSFTMRKPILFFFPLHEVLMTAFTFKIRLLTGFKSGIAKGKAAGHRPFYKQLFV